MLSFIGDFLVESLTKFCFFFIYFILRLRRRSKALGLSSGWRPSKCNGARIRPSLTCIRLACCSLKCLKSRCRGRKKAIFKLLGWCKVASISRSLPISIRTLSPWQTIAGALIQVNVPRWQMFAIAFLTWLTIAIAVANLRHCDLNRFSLSFLGAKDIILY